MEKKQVELKVVKMVPFRKMVDCDYDAFAGAGDDALINEESIRVHAEKETCDAIVIISEGQISIEVIGEDYEAEWFFDTKTKNNDYAQAIFSVQMEKFGGIPREDDLMGLGFEKRF